MTANDRDVSVFKNIGGPKIPSTVLRCKPQNKAPETKKPADKR
jgi:hypothetical protein